jgi:DNA-binding transcriptional LysR family regulator
VRLTADVPMMIVGAPDYFARRPPPTTLQELLRHNCIALRMPTSGAVYAWELLDNGQPVDARVRGQALFSSVYPMLDAALAGVGLAFLPQDLAGEHVRAGRLVSVMQDWCPVFPGLHAFYPSRRNSSRALGLVVDAIRYRAEND